MTRASLCKRESLEKGEREMTFVILSLSPVPWGGSPLQEAEIKVKAVCGSFCNINCLGFTSP